jgi:ubiquinone/menaquinone biosynthesis C-methylase UbiE
MKVFNNIRKIMQPLARTPLHPQWLMRGGTKRIINYLENICDHQRVLDIGCFNKWPKKHINSTCSYIGLDYYETATHWYGSVPDIYGNALSLPVRSNSIDIVLLLDVLEHLPDSNEALGEINRVLKPNGRLIMQVPFLYPLHDEPRDYVRFTRHGLKEAARKNGFSVEDCIATGHPVETSALLSNIAISKTVLEWVRDKNLAAVLILLLPLIVLVNNLLARAISYISKEDHFMPYSYQLILLKDHQ